MTNTTKARVSVRDEYAPMFGRQRLTLWEGAFASEYLGEAMELPRGDGFMVRLGLYEVRKVRVACPAPRTDANFSEVDAAIAAAVGAEPAFSPGVAF